MKLNDIYDGFFGGIAKYLDEEKFVYAPNSDTDDGNDQKLYLMNLLDDSYEEIVTLTGDETFNAGKGGMSFCFGLNWVNAKKVKYAVFDQSKKTDLESCPDNPEDIPFFIKYRTVNI